MSKQEQNEENVERITAEHVDKSNIETKSDTATRADVRSNRREQILREQHSLSTGLETLARQADEVRKTTLSIARQTLTEEIPEHSSLLSQLDTLEGELLDLEGLSNKLKMRIFKDYGWTREKTHYNDLKGISEDYQTLFYKMDTFWNELCKIVGPEEVRVLADNFPRTPQEMLKTPIPHLQSSTLKRGTLPEIQLTPPDLPKSPVKEATIHFRPEPPVDTGTPLTAGQCLDNLLSANQKPSGTDIVELMRLISPIFFSGLPTTSNPAQGSWKATIPRFPTVSHPHRKIPEGVYYEDFLVYKASFEAFVLGQHVSEDQKLLALREGIKSDTVFADLVNNPGITTYDIAMRQLARLVTPLDLATFWTDKINALSVDSVQGVQTYKIKLDKYLGYYTADTGSVMDLPARWKVIRQAMPPSYTCELIKQGYLDSPLTEASLDARLRKYEQIWQAETISHSNNGDHKEDKKKDDKIRQLEKEIIRLKRRQDQTEPPTHKPTEEEKPTKSIDGKKTLFPGGTLKFVLDA